MTLAFPPVCLLARGREEHGKRIVGRGGVKLKCSAVGIAVQQSLQALLGGLDTLRQCALHDLVDTCGRVVVGQGGLKLQQRVYIGAQRPGKRTEQRDVWVRGIGLPFADCRCGYAELVGQLFLCHTACFAQSGNFCAQF